MSEYQYIAFRAIDGPVSEDNLKYMRRQSSRAEVTPWSFDNEYHFGDFGGNAAEMLRRGYDFHLHYANFGERTIMIRLAAGLPDAKAAKAYFEADSLAFVKDKSGVGGNLRMSPFYEPGDLDEPENLEALVTQLMQLRAEILAGDLRPLYIAHLGISKDGNHDPDEETEVSVPAGLDQLTRGQRELAEFYNVSDALIEAAARNSPPMRKADDAGSDYNAWLARQSDAKKTQWLARVMAEQQAAVRAEILAAFREDQQVSTWPTAPSKRKVSELLAIAEEIEREQSRKSADASARRRAKRLADLAADPQPALRETEQLVNQRSSNSYAQIARLLADLREALAGSKQADLPETQARKLKAQHPTLALLTSELRKKGFLIR
jgi:hypothetical protein